MHSVGSGAGLGHSINVPWNTNPERQTPGDAEYLYAFERVLLPVSPHDHGGLWLLSEMSVRTGGKRVRAGSDPGVGGL